MKYCARAAQEVSRTVPAERFEVQKHFDVVVEHAIKKFRPRFIGQRDTTAGEKLRSTAKVCKRGSDARAHVGIPRQLLMVRTAGLEPCSR
jgi:hypothetical protein